MRFKYGKSKYINLFNILSVVAQAITYATINLWHPDVMLAGQSWVAPSHFSLRQEKPKNLFPDLDSCLFCCYPRSLSMGKKGLTADSF